jgi:hypothetical protein
MFAIVSVVDAYTKRRKLSEESHGVVNISDGRLGCVVNEERKSSQIFDRRPISRQSKSSLLSVLTAAGAVHQVEKNIFESGSPTSVFCLSFDNYELQRFQVDNKSQSTCGGIGGDWDWFVPTDR